MTVIFKVSTRVIYNPHKLKKKTQINGCCEDILQMQLKPNQVTLRKGAYPGQSVESPKIQGWDCSKGKEIPFTGSTLVIKL